MYLTYGSNTPISCPARMSRRVSAQETLTTGAMGPAAMAKILEALSVMNKTHAMAFGAVRPLVYYLTNTQEGSNMQLKRAEKDSRKPENRAGNTSVIPSSLLHSGEPERITCWATYTWSSKND